MAKARRREADTTVPGASSDPALETSQADTPQTAPQSVGDTSVASPDRERIAMRAYELYLARGASDGAALDDWLTAEREVSSTGPDRNRDSE